jgi:tripartite-type tricarboxylate transporter receptor subunit TctC
LAVTNTTRAAVVPDVPTITEAGFPQLALFGRPSMPDRVRESIAADVGKAIDPVVKDRLSLTGQIPNFGGPAQFAADIEQQRARLAVAAKDLGIMPIQ